MTFSYKRKIEFADTDLSGLVHFSRFFVFMETAEHEFLRSLGAEVHMQHEGHEIGWPRVKATCEYLSTIGFGDEIEIHVSVERKGTKSMTYGFDFRKGETQVARGEITAVCCVLDDPAGIRAIAVPPLIADQV
jgi:YbgC/YbaW family acyl-CoA thioester hydrolase